MRISLKAENLLLSCFQLSVAAGLVKGGPAGNLCPVGDGAWGQGLALQHGSDCLGERLASQEAGAGWSSGPVRSTSRTSVLESIPRIRVGKERTAAQGMS